MSKDWKHPSKREQKWLDYVLNPAPEPRPHVCGRCRNPFTGGRADCPNAGRIGG